MKIFLVLLSINFNKCFITHLSFGELWSVLTTYGMDLKENCLKFDLFWNSPALTLTWFTFVIQAWSVTLQMLFNYIILKWLFLQIMACLLLIQYYHHDHHHDHFYYYYYYLKISYNLHYCFRCHCFLIWCMQFFIYFTVIRIQKDFIVKPDMHYSYII